MRIETGFTAKRLKHTHIFAREPDNFYVEPYWCAIRLFEVERFPKRVWDPFCGSGRVAEAARAAGHEVRATDIVARGYAHQRGVKDFLTVDRIDPDVSLTGNPPFDDQILQHVVRLDPVKAAMIWPFARLVAAHEWLSTAPLARVLMLTPRPPMPPASYIAAGRKPEGARVEHCWLIFERGHRGRPQLDWLHRDRAV
jgi:hypothetical protein